MSAVSDIVGRQKRFDEGVIYHSSPKATHRTLSSESSFDTTKSGYNYSSELTQSSCYPSSTEFTYTSTPTQSFRSSVSSASSYNTRRIESSYDPSSESSYNTALTHTYCDTVSSAPTCDTNKSDSTYYTINSETLVESPKLRPKYGVPGPDPAYDVPHSSQVGYDIPSSRTTPLVGSDIPSSRTTPQVGYDIPSSRTTPQVGYDIPSQSSKFTNGGPDLPVVGENKEDINLFVPSLYSSLDPVIKSVNVVQLDDTSFKKFIRQKDVTLVMFYNSCTSKKSLSDVYYKKHFAKAAATTCDRNHAFATVDCSTDSVTCNMENVASLPQFKLYSRGATVGTITSDVTIDHKILSNLVVACPTLEQIQPSQNTCQKK